MPLVTLHISGRSSCVYTPENPEVVGEVIHAVTNLQSSLVASRGGRGWSEWIIKTGEWSEPEVPKT